MHGTQRHLFITTKEVILIFSKKKETKLDQEEFLKLAYNCATYNNASSFILFTGDQ